jgi:hypothetical protein
MTIAPGPRNRAPVIGAVAALALVAAGLAAAQPSEDVAAKDVRPARAKASKVEALNVKVKAVEGSSGAAKGDSSNNIKQIPRASEAGARGQPEVARPKKDKRKAPR